MDDEQLLGDKTEAILKAIKVDRIMKAARRITKRPCNCGHRKMQLNELHRKLRASKNEREARDAEKRN
jgi:hypothetical protein